MKPNQVACFCSLTCKAFFFCFVLFCFVLFFGSLNAEQSKTNIASKLLVLSCCVGGKLMNRMSATAGNNFLNWYSQLWKQYPADCRFQSTILSMAFFFTNISRDALELQSIAVGEAFCWRIEQDYFCWFRLRHKHQQHSDRKTLHSREVANAKLPDVCLKLLLLLLSCSVRCL